MMVSHPLHVNVMYVRHRQFLRNLHQPIRHSVGNRSLILPSLKLRRRAPKLDILQWLIRFRGILLALLMYRPNPQRFHRQRRRRSLCSPRHHLCHPIIIRLIRNFRVVFVNSRMRKCRAWTVRSLLSIHRYPWHSLSVRVLQGRNPKIFVCCRRRLVQGVHRCRVYPKKIVWTLILSLVRCSVLTQGLGCLNKPTWTINIAIFQETTSTKIIIETCIMRVNRV